MKNTVKYISIYTFILVILPMAMRGLGQTSTAATNLFNALAYIVLGLSGWVLFSRELEAQIRAAFSKPFKLFLKSVLTFLIIIALSALSLLIFKTTQPTENQQAVNSFMSSSFFSAIIVVIIGPFAEELLFRHILVGKMKAYMPLWLACTISVLLFGIIHVHSFTLSGILEARQYIIIGSVVTALYVKNGDNIAYPWAAHTLNNLISTIILAAAAQ